MVLEDPEVPKIDENRYNFQVKAKQAIKISQVAFKIAPRELLGAQMRPKRRPKRPQDLPRGAQDPQKII